MGDLLNIFTSTNWLIESLIGIFWAILFLQSGLDKVFDWKGNLSWLNGHFEKSILKSLVTPMLGTLTLVEIIAGGVSFYGVIHLLMTGSYSVIKTGLVISTIALLMLFFGQRLAKDYDGAKTIAIYFGVALISLLLLK